MTESVDEKQQVIDLLEGYGCTPSYLKEMPLECLKDMLQIFVSHDIAVEDGTYEPPRRRVTDENGMEVEFIFSDDETETTTADSI